MKAKLKIRCEGTTREETVELKASSAGALLTAAKLYLQPVNEGLPYEKQHHLLSVTPGEPITPGQAPTHRALIR